MLLTHQDRQRSDQTDDRNDGDRRRDHPIYLCELRDQSTDASDPDRCPQDARYSFHPAPHRVDVCGMRFHGPTHNTHNTHTQHTHSTHHFEPSRAPRRTARFMSSTVMSVRSSTARPRAVGRSSAKRQATRPSKQPPHAVRSNDRARRKLLPFPTAKGQSFSSRPVQDVQHVVWRHHAAVVGREVQQAAGAPSRRCWEVVTWPRFAADLHDMADGLADDAIAVDVLACGPLLCPDLQPELAPDVLHVLRSRSRHRSWRRPQPTAPAASAATRCTQSRCTTAPATTRPATIAAAYAFTRWPASRLGVR